MRERLKYIFGSVYEAFIFFEKKKVKEVRERLKNIFGSIYEAFIFLDVNGTNIIDRTELRRGSMYIYVSVYTCKYIYTYIHT